MTNAAEPLLAHQSLPYAPGSPTRMPSATPSLLKSTTSWKPGTPALVVFVKFSLGSPTDARAFVVATYSATLSVFVAPSV